MPALLGSCAAIAVLLLAAPATAQYPVCAPPAAGEMMLSSCRSWPAEAVTRFLDDFTVDHLFKPALPSFERSWLQVATAFATTTIKTDEAFRNIVKQLEPLRFTRLDRTTGSVSCDLAASPRRIDLEPTGFGQQVPVQLRLPETLEGGYWRGPDVLQVAFWKQKRVGIRVQGILAQGFLAQGFLAQGMGVSAVDGEVECVALSPDGLLVRFADGASPPIYVSFRDCPQ